MNWLKGFAISSYIPDTWKIEFRSRYEAHAYYDSVIHYFDDRLGRITVSNNGWYIWTKIPKNKFEDAFNEFMAKQNISKDEYSIEFILVRGY
ncbi:hypothetical protein M5C72_00415 [Companilactobacillus allii]|uniref:Uncharacterized protein n=1 Tax=Companilactobacillus allii TaxID=1847728 RepID=A0A1P8Q1B4_9LACO|nr:hypothetical protein [Companilactobacillus allii]APX71650.1 hypothetical protein BTM29_03350 [Companilactobacillus allii]USQ68733.1 hypothetical protein M5C72_00415 [Companilactobacillus allii]